MSKASSRPSSERWNPLPSGRNDRLAGTSAVPTLFDEILAPLTFILSPREPVALSDATGDGERVRVRGHFQSNRQQMEQSFPEFRPHLVGMEIDAKRTEDMHKRIMPGRTAIEWESWQTL